MISLGQAVQALELLSRTAAGATAAAAAAAAATWLNLPSMSSLFPSLKELSGKWSAWNYYLLMM